MASFAERLSATAAGRLEPDKGGWVVRSTADVLVARIETWYDPPRLLLTCAEGAWRVGWDEDRHLFSARPEGEASWGATLTRSAFGADATLRREPDGAEATIDLRRVPRRRWVVSSATIVRDGDALRFEGHADPLFLLLGLWHAAVAERLEPASRRMKGVGPQPLADRASSYRSPFGR